MRSIRDIFSDRSYFLNLLFTFLSQICTATSLLILTPKILTILGPKDFSTYAIILNSVLICSIFDFGMNQGLLRRSIHERSILDTLFNTMLIFYLFFGFAALIISYSMLKLGVLNPVRFDYVGICIVVFYSVQTILINLFDVIIQSVQKLFLAKIFRIIKTIIEFAFILTFIKNGSLYFIFGITLTVNFLYIIVLTAYVIITQDISPSFFKFSFSSLTGHIKYSFWYFVTSLSVNLVFNTQIYILNKNLEVQELSRYILYAKIFEIIRTSIANFTTVLIPKIIKTEYEGDNYSVLDLYKKSLASVALLLGMVLLVLLIFGRDLFLFWTKSQITFDNQLFYMFLIYNILVLLDNVSALYLTALKLNKLPTIISIAQGAIIVISSLILIGQYGIYGLIFASIIALLITNMFFNPIYLLKSLRIDKSVQ